jgi:hypothetical protein
MLICIIHNSGSMLICIICCETNLVNIFFR